VADAIARFKPEVYWKVRDNLRHVLGSESGEKALHASVHAVFEHAGQTYYDFFRAIGQPCDVLANSVRIAGSLVTFLSEERRAGRGVLLLGVHMSNFDLGILALGAHDLPAQILSLGGPQDGFGLLNDLRQMEGFEVTPVGPMALRDAVRRLRSAGLVMTGADRPVASEEDELVPFFGKPARLPLGPARLALMTGATVLLGACYRHPAEGYVLHVTGPIEMVKTGDRRSDVVVNTQRLAQVMESYIRARPTQWLMFHRLWPGE
jgi:KDO2-lipid IV(A) lauroyltransferase